MTDDDEYDDDDDVWRPRARRRPRGLMIARDALVHAWREARTEWGPQFLPCMGGAENRAEAAGDAADPISYCVCGRASGGGCDAV